MYSLRYCLEIAMSKRKKTVKVKPMSYQPSKAELEADVSIDTTPDKLVKAVVEGVHLKPTLKIKKL